MKNLSFAFILGLLFCFAVFAQTSELNIIPQPKSISRTKGEFKLNRKTKIIVGNDRQRQIASLFNEHLYKSYGFKLEIVSNKPKNNSINLITVDYGQNIEQSKKEQYILEVVPKQISIYGTETGLFYGIQTLIQLLPLGFKNETKIQAVTILDSPRFQYRGMHLDVGRHFMPVEFVKKYIDLMAQYKFNQFHWHLTDDQGWRIEIKKYPRLTEIGSKRKESQEGRYTTTFKGDGVPVEGFYTQEQIKEVVAYAKARHINVIPEIELPGHSSAALAAYPELAIP